MHHPIRSRLSVLSLALLAASSQAQEATLLEPITIKSDGTGNPTAPVKDWQALARSTTTDVRGALQNEPGIAFGGGNGASQWTTIRGLGESNIDFDIDGTTSTSQIFHHQSRFMSDPALMKQIRVEKGTGAASAGIGVIGGAIRAETLDATDLLAEGQSAGARINGGISSNKGHNGGFAVYGQAGQVDGIAIANWNTDKDYKDGHGNKIAHSGLGGRSFLAKGNYHIDEHNRISLSQRREEQYGERNLREEFSFGNDRDLPRHRHRISDTSNLAYQGRGLGAIGDIDSNLFYIDNRQKSEGETVRLKTQGFNLGFTTPLADSGHRLKYGINQRQEKTSPGSHEKARHDQKKSDIGGYLEGIWDFKPVTLTTGVRYDRFELHDTGHRKTSGSRISPSVGAIWDVNDDLALRASYNTASRSPRLYETLLADTDIRFSNRVKAEQARTAEIGGTWRIGGFEIDGSYYQQTIKDLQNYRGAGCTGRNCAWRELVSDGKLKNRGYEVSAAWQWEGLTARAGVNHSKPKINGATADTIASAIPMGRQWHTGLAYRFDDPALEVGWRGRYAEKSSYNNEKGETTRRAGYGVHDLYVNWQPLGKDNFNVNFAINNVGDKYYRSHSQRAGGISLPEAGREFLLNFNYRV